MPSRQSSRRTVTLIVIVALHGAAAALFTVGQLWSGAALGMVVFAYTRGLLHALDADHLAMIDGSTRKLLGERLNPHGVGLAFSLGHSTVVLTAGVAVVAGAAWIRDAIDGESALALVLGTIGASVSALYLLAVASANLPLLVAAVRGGETGHAHSARGWTARALAAPLARVRHAGHVYLFGLLFGLGFDTASTISLLMLTAAGAVAGVPPVALLGFPLAFAAGMTLGDSTNSAIMLRVYTAADTPARRRLNIALLVLSIVSAFAVATMTLTELVGGFAGVAVPEFDTTPWGWALAALALGGFLWLGWLRLSDPLSRAGGPR